MDLRSVRSPHSQITGHIVGKRKQGKPRDFPPMNMIGNSAICHERTTQDQSIFGGRTRGVQKVSSVLDISGESQEAICVTDSGALTR